VQMAPVTASKDRKYVNATYNNRRWRAIRQAQLDAYPLCRICLEHGQTTIATQVDHILRLKQGGTNANANLQSLCASCHSRKTQAEERELGHRRKG
jgi:5-methylcytosine-specific restriction protein A